MKILVTGANGQLGQDLMRVIVAAGDEAVGIDIDTVDITSREAVHEALATIYPDAVINCAAFTAVDACEDNADTAMLVNGTAVRWVTEASDAVGAHLVRQLGLLALRAGPRVDLRQRVVGPALRGALFGMASFWIWHRSYPCVSVSSTRRARPAVGRPTAVCTHTSHGCD